MAMVDITVAHGSATALACALAAGRRYPFVYRQISDTQFWANTRFRRWRVATYLSRARRVVALSAKASSDLVGHLGLDADSITIVPNGVPCKSYAPPTPAQRAAARRRFECPPDAFVVLDIGALVIEKGVHVAIAAIRSVEHAVLLIVGDGPERAGLEELAEDMGDRVRFAGPMTDPYPAYCAADVVVLPSLGGDSMPATLIESGFCGLPVITTDIGSITDVVVHETTGFVVPTNDADELARALERLRLDHEVRAQMGEAARRYCLDRFEISVVAERWHTMLSETLSPATYDGQA